MSNHKEFCDWLLRNHAALSREALMAGDAVARWLFVLEGGSASPEAHQYAAEALKTFEELCGRCPTSSP